MALYKLQRALKSWYYLKFITVLGDESEHLYFTDRVTKLEVEDSNFGP